MNIKFLFTNFLDKIFLLLKHFQSLIFTKSNELIKSLFIRRPYTSDNVTKKREQCKCIPVIISFCRIITQILAVKVKLTVKTSTKRPIYFLFFVIRCI